MDFNQAQTETCLITSTGMSYEQNIVLFFPGLDRIHTS